MRSKAVSISGLLYTGFYTIIPTTTDSTAGRSSAYHSAIIPLVLLALDDFRMPLDKAHKVATAKESL